MATDELLTRGTVLVALVLYVLSLALRLRAAGRRCRLEVARCAWAGGWVFFLLHVVCAFEFYHDWSHQLAYQSTARETAEVVGLDWGGGLYANYAFALVWLGDVLWWCFRSESYLARRPAVEWIVQGFLGFIALNATVVFGQGMIRWFGLAGCALLAAIGWLTPRHAPPLPN
jgi:hypothetical protein